MKIKILDVSNDALVDALIKSGRPVELPSIHLGWKFNFASRLRELKDANAYILVAQETSSIIEGCLIFQMQDKIVPYMSYVEIAPHNRTDPKKYDYVAGCLIAFACKQSFIQGKEHNSGWLTFDVLEENKQNEVALMANYSRKYRAQRWTQTTTMLIEPKDGILLIQEYLERGENQSPETV